MDLSKIEIDILNLRTEGYELSYDEIKRDIRELCANYSDNIEKYVALSSTLYNKMWQNDLKMVYFKSDDKGHIKVIDLIYDCYVSNSSNKNKYSNDFLFNYDKDNRKNRDLIKFLNKKGWYYSH